MKIAVAAHGLRAGGGRVVGTNLLRVFAEEGTDEYLFVVPDQIPYRDLELERGRHAAFYYPQSGGYVTRLYFDWVTLPRLIRRFEPDAFLGLGNRGLLGLRCPQAVYLHNPYLVYPDAGRQRLGLVDRSWLTANQLHVRRVLPHTDLVICQTSTMERRFRESFGYDGPAAISPLPVSDFPSWDGSQPDVLRPYQGKTKLLYVTRYYPHKGIENLVDLMSRHRDKLGDVVVLLTIDADQHVGADRVLRRIEREGLQSLIVNLGPQSHAELVSYYEAVDAVIVPTLLESFSSSYLEAMGFGLPILTSDLDFARDVCGSAAIYFDRDDTASILRSIRRLIDTPGLAKSLADMGRERLAASYGMTWSDVGNGLLLHLREMVERVTP